MIDSIKMPAYLQELFAYRSVFYQLVRQYLVLRYRRTVLGFVWTLVNPLLMLSVTALVFSTIFKLDLATYSTYLFAGMVPWTFFSTSTTQACGSLISNEGLIKKIYLPKIIFPLSVCVGNLFDSLLSFVALFILIAVFGSTISWALLFIPIAFILIFLFTLGFSLALSTLTVYFRDVQYVVGILLQAVFFLTPIIYKRDGLSGWAADLVALNPLLHFIDLFRLPLYQGVLPHASTILAAVSMSLLSLGVGALVFVKHEKKIVFRL